MDVLELREMFGDRMFDENETILFEDYNSKWPPEKSIAFSLEQAQKWLAERIAFIERMEPGSHASSFHQFVKTKGESRYLEDRRRESPDDIDDRDPEYDPDEEDDDNVW